jgi:hypothetical protein
MRVKRQGEDSQDAEIVRVAAYAGLRHGELLALRWRDVDFAGLRAPLAQVWSHPQSLGVYDAYCSPIRPPPR